MPKNIAFFTGYIVPPGLMTPPPPFPILQIKMKPTPVFDMLVIYLFMVCL